MNKKENILQNEIKATIKGVIIAIINIVLIFNFPVVGFCMVIVCTYVSIQLIKKNLHNEGSAFPYYLGVMVLFIILMVAGWADYAPNYIN